MDDIVRMYFDFIDTLDPFRDTDEDPTAPESMLYNLEEIKKGWQFDETDTKKINELIAAFKAAGIKII